MKNQRVQVTGGAGFIGSNLAEELAKENEVVILDDLSTGRMENIKELVEMANVKFIRGSITDLHFLQKNFSNIDYVFHLAAMPGVPESIKDPISSNNVNINGTLNVLVAARDNQIKKVIYASSCAVYGDTTIVPTAETASFNPKSPYAVAKLAGEYYCSTFSEVYDLPTTSLRYFNVYGPRQNPDSEYAAVVPKFIRNVLDGRPPIIYGDGLQTRDFVFVKDVVRANLMAAESRETGVFNIGYGASTTIAELAGTIIESLDKNIEPLYEEPREGDIRHSFADISKARSAIGYEPSYSLEKGLKETIRWYQD
jgi:UDP-glucose 4-epimerase